MKDKLERFTNLEQRIAAEKGAFSLFALFLREDAPGKWDLVVAAPWMNADRAQALGYLTDQLKREFEPLELMQLSRVVIVDQHNPALETINRVMPIAHGAADVQNGNFFGLQMKQAYIITSQQLPAGGESVVTAQPSLVSNGQ